MEKKIINVKANDKLANVISDAGFSYNAACKMIRNKDVKVDGLRVKDNIDVFIGSEVVIFYQESAKAQKFEILFEDDNILIVNKKAGIEVEGEDGLTAQISGALAVHRLDRNTEGLLVMAKNQRAKEILINAFKARQIEKKYLAEVVGATDFQGKTYNAYLLKDKETAFVKISSDKIKGSEEISTAFKTIKSNPASSVVECNLITGKTHQIRAHLAFLGHPIIGDGKYGKNIDNKKFKQKTQKLFCYYLKFKNIEPPLNYLNNKKFEKLPSWLEKMP